MCVCVCVCDVCCVCLCCDVCACDVMCVLVVCVWVWGAGLLLSMKGMWSSSMPKVLAWGVMKYLFLVP